VSTPPSLFRGQSRTDAIGNRDRLAVQPRRRDQRPSGATRTGTLVRLWGRRGGRGKIAVLIGEASTLTGKCIFHGTTVVNGTVDGEILCRGTLTVGPRGLARANITADSVVIEGEVVGNVTVQKRVELTVTARMVGDIQAPVIMISEGVQFHGNCRVTPDEPSGDGTASAGPGGARRNPHSKAPSLRAL